MTRFCIALALALVFASSSAMGSPFTIEVSGTIESIRDPASALDASVVVGGHYNAFFTFDSERADNRPDDPSLGFYGTSLVPLPFLAATGRIGDLSLADRQAELFLGDNTPYLHDGELISIDTLSVKFRDVTIPGVNCVLDGISSGPCHIFQIGFTDLTGLVLDSDEIPDIFPALSDWSSGSMIMGITGLPFSHPNYLRVVGTVDRFAVVPEPSTGFLLMLGLIGIASRTRPEDTDWLSGELPSASRFLTAERATCN